MLPATTFDHGRYHMRKQMIREETTTTTNILLRDTLISFYALRDVVKFNVHSK